MTEEVSLFLELSEPLLGSGRAEEGTMMGFPCLRTDGAFFATSDHRSGDLIVKLPADRVDELIGEGIGEPFAPAGRRFKEWVAVRDRDRERWEALLAEALEFVAGGNHD